MPSLQNPFSKGSFSSPPRSPKPFGVGAFIAAVVTGSGHRAPGRTSSLAGVGDVSPQKPPHRRLASLRLPGRRNQQEEAPPLSSPLFYVDSDGEEECQSAGSSPSRRKSSVERFRVTLANTKMNEALNREGEQIRKQLTASEELTTLIDVTESGDDLSLPPALCIEPPTPVPPQDDDADPTFHMEKPPAFPGPSSSDDQNWTRTKRHRWHSDGSTSAKNRSDFR